jgi:adenine-specific DNA-methyltransferase
LFDLLKKLSKGRGKAEAEMEEWQIPREAESGWSAEFADTHEKLLRLRRERQAEIDASIARRADTELLIDRPYLDGKRIRVTGPFTVESHGDEVLKVFGVDGERS